jgi:hypothetical protein
MAHPLASIPASIRLKTSTLPTAGKVDMDGSIVTALLVGQLSDYAASVALSASVQSGVSLVVPAVGVDVSDVAPGSTGTGTGYASATSVTKVTPGSQKANCKLVSGSHVVALSPLVVETDLAVGSLVIGTLIPSNAAIGATSLQPRSTSLSITTTAGSATVNLASGTTAAMRIGMVVVAPTIPAGYTVATIASSTQFTLSSGTSVTAGTATAATATSIVAAKRTISIVTSAGSTTVTTASTAGLVAGQQVLSATCPSGTTISSITNDTTFVLSAAPGTSVTEDMTCGALITISHKDTNTTSVAASGASSAATLSFGPVLEMASAASLSSTGTYTFVGNGRTMTDMRDGDYCIVAVRLTSSSGAYETYIMGYGYLRRSSSGLKQFYLYDSETGGSPVTALDTPPLLFGYEAPPYVVAIFQKPKLEFAYTGTRRLTSRLLAAPSLTRGTPSMTFPVQRVTSRLLAAPAFVGITPSQYIRFTGAQLVLSRVIASPNIRSIERNITFDSLNPPRVKSRLLARPAFTGGYLRVGSYAQASITVGAFDIRSHGEELHFRGAPCSIIGRATGELSGNHQFRRAPYLIRGLVRGALDFVITGRGLSVRDVVSDCIGVWNMRLNPRCLGAPDDVKERAIADLNAALQVIYSRAHRLDYFNKSTLKVTVAANAKTADLPNTVQAVLGTARWKETENATTSKPLAAMSTLADAQQFSDLYAVVGSAPMAYYIDTRTQPEANVVKSTLMVVPVQTAQIYVDVEIAAAAPRYTWRDVELATPLQLPSTYAESLLMPIIRHRATSFRLFTNAQLKQTIDVQYQKAQLALGLVDPKPAQAAKPQTANVGGIEQ